MKKKFLVICLSSIMLVMALLSCGFVSPKQVNAQEVELHNISTDGGYVGNVYFDTTKTRAEMDSYFSTFTYDQHLPVIPFIINTENVLMVLRQQIAPDTYGYILYYPSLDSLTDVQPESIIYLSLGDLAVEQGWLKSSISVNKPCIKSSIFRDQIVFTVQDSSYFAQTDYPKEEFVINEYSFIPPTQSGEFDIYFNTYLTVTEINNYLSNLPFENGSYTLFSSAGNEITAYKINNDYAIYYTQQIDSYSSAGVIYSSFIGSFTPSSGYSIDTYYIGFDLTQLEDNALNFYIDITDYYIDTTNAYPLFSTIPFTYTKIVTITGELLTVIKDIFVTYPLILATSVINMFTNLFVTDGVLNIFGSALVCLFGIALVSSIFYTVYRIFKNKNKNKM